MFLLLSMFQWPGLCAVVSVQHLFGSPHHPHLPVGGGDQPGRVAHRGQSVQGQGHILLLRRHGTLHQRARHVHQLFKGKQLIVIHD